MKTLVIGLLLLGTIVGGGPCENSGVRDKVSAYNYIKDDIQNSVTGYATDNNGAFPYLNGSYSVSECINCSIIDVNALLTSNGGMLREVPNGIYSTPGSDNDNCDGGATGCSSSNHYVWLVNDYGSVFSKCMGSDCNGNNATGYQGVWP